jgi:hypothetical protein
VEKKGAEGSKSQQSPPAKEGRTFEIVISPVVEIREFDGGAIPPAGIPRKVDLKIKVYRRPKLGGILHATFFHVADETQFIDRKPGIDTGPHVVIEFDTSGATVGDEYKLVVELIHGAQTVTDSLPILPIV